MVSRPEAVTPRLRDAAQVWPAVVMLNLGVPFFA